MAGIGTATCFAGPLEGKGKLRSPFPEEKLTVTQELAREHKKLTRKAEDLQNGLKDTVLRKSPKAVKVARNHTSFLTKFVKEGSDEVQKKHPKTNWLEIGLRVLLIESLFLEASVVVPIAESFIYHPETKLPH